MTAQLDLAVTLPTMLRSAGTYSLALDDDALYVIRVGPAMGPNVDPDSVFALRQHDLQLQAAAKLGAAMAQPALRAIEKRFGEKIDAGLQQLDARGYEAMASEKGSFRFERGDVRSIEPGRKGSMETLELKTSARSFRFRVTEATGDDLRAFAEGVRQWAGLGG